MHGVNILIAIVIGIFAGWIAERLMNRNHGILTNLVVGVVGSFIGAFILKTLGLQDAYGFWGSLGVSVLGAVVLLFLLGLLKR